VGNEPLLLYPLALDSVQNPQIQNLILGTARRHVRTQEVTIGMGDLERNNKQCLRLEG
jgi:hypothetical protein